MQTVTALAAKTGKSKAQIVEEALRNLEDRVFWTEVQQSFASGPESDALRAETELWASSVPDGFRE